MSYQWLQMRITEERDRRERERLLQERLPRAMAELHGYLATCIESYTEAFGPDSATADVTGAGIRVVVREQLSGEWRTLATVEIKPLAEPAGFQIERAGETLLVEVGMLPGDRIFFRDHELDQFLTVEELTRRILDRALFPKLRE